MVETPVILTTKQAAALAKIQQQEQNLERIKLANAQLYSEQAAELDLTPTPPERKPTYQPVDDLKPYLKIGEFVKVDEKTEAGYNRIEGYGYITEAFGAGAAAFYSVKFTPAYDGGRTHKQVRLGDLTCCSPFDECLPENTKRVRKSAVPEPELVEEVPDDRLPIQKLCDALVLGARRGKSKGWHRRSLDLGNGRYLRDDEEQQFKTELMILEQYLDEPSIQKLKLERKTKARYKKSKKYRKMKTDPLTIDYFVCVAWGLSTGFLSKFRKRMKLKQQSTVKGLEYSDEVDYFMVSKKDEHKNKTVIDCLELATERFTPEYLYAINRCRGQAIDDPTSITTKEYWERHKQARVEYKDTDEDTQALWTHRTRQHLHLQPQIPSLILSALDKDPKRSWLGLEVDIQYWCSACTIRKWLLK